MKLFLFYIGAESWSILQIKSKFVARDVGIEPTRPFDHRLSRPAPYQAWGIPHAIILLPYP